MSHFMLRSDSNGEVKAVQTFKNTLYSKKAIIVAAGCWTGYLIQDLFRNWGMELHVPVKPRKVCTELIFHDLGFLDFFLYTVIYDALWYILLCELKGRRFYSGHSFIFSLILSYIMNC